MAHPNDTLAFCAYASALLAYHKVMDDRADEKGHRRRKAVMATPYVKSLRRRALKAGYGVLDENISLAMRQLSAMEAERTPSVDRPAECFGELMSQVVACGLEGNAARIGKTIGHHVGRWIYLVDAIDDYEEDRGKGRYNPLDCLWQGGELTSTRKSDLSNSLMRELLAVEAALDLCDTEEGENSNLWGSIRNILYMGMPHAAHRVLYPEHHCSQCKEKNK